MPRKLIIDTDPGIDDAVAILMAAASPELELLGLTTVFGNVDVDAATRNALHLLDIACRPDLPVAAGAANPLAMPYLGAIPHIHGEDGMGGAAMAPAGSPVDVSAAEFLWRTVSAHPGEVTLLAVGPLTNLALALHLHPDLAGQVAEVVVMGGNALVPGNATPTAEANMRNDPEAADVVFGARWPVTMVGLDVTHQVNMLGADLDRLFAADNPAARHLARALPLYRQFLEATNGLDGIYLHDPSAVAYLLDPGAFTTSAWPLRVETQGISRGKTWPDVGGTDEMRPRAWLGRPPVTVCVDVDGRRVVDLLLDRLTGDVGPQ